MKKLTLFSLLLFSTIVLTSCGSDDPKGTPTQQTISKTWTFPIKGVGGASITLPYTINLSDVLGADNAKNFISGEFQNLNNYIQVSGLKNMDGVVLNNFTLQVNSTSVNLGKVTATPGTNDFGSDVDQATTAISSFASTLFSVYTGKSKTATLNVAFTPNKDIVAADNVNLSITVNGKYNWNTFPN